MPTHNPHPSYPPVKFRHFLITCLAPVLAWAGTVPSGKPAKYPDWWFTRDVIPKATANATPAWPADYASTDDFAVANIGQLKHLAAKAAAELDSYAPVLDAGSSIHDLIAGWSGTNSSRDDYGSVNLGQLKAVAELFYAKLQALGYTGAPLSAGQTRPWDNASSPADDYALANVGQLKRVFSFNPRLLFPQDTDFLVLRAIWDSGEGGDMDTRTAVVESGTEIDGDDVGWARGDSVSLNSHDILRWAFDNTGVGTEAVLIDYAQLRQALPEAENVRVRFRSFWFGSMGSGNFKLTLTRYHGGVMTAHDCNWINTGGAPTGYYEAQRYSNLELGSDVDGQDMAVIDINPDTLGFTVTLAPPPPEPEE